MTIRNDVVRRLVATGKWGEDPARLGERAGYVCEYCGLDLLSSPENYKEWQTDHIVPQGCGGTDDFDNLALSCRTCNVSFKSRWNPRDCAGDNASREDLIAAARVYISRKKAEARAEVNKVREIVGRKYLI